MWDKTVVINDAWAHVAMAYINSKEILSRLGRLVNREDSGRISVKSLSNDTNLSMTAEPTSSWVAVFEIAVYKQTTCIG